LLSDEEFSWAEYSSTPHYLEKPASPEDDWPTILGPSRNHPVKIPTGSGIRVSEKWNRKKAGGTDT